MEKIHPSGVALRSKCVWYLRGTARWDILDGTEEMMVGSEA